MKIVPAIKYLAEQVGAFWIVGGYVRRQLEGTPIDRCDIDIYQNGRSLSYWERNFHATTGPNSSCYFKFNGRTFNVLRPTATSVSQVLNQFDFTCCQVALHTDGGEFDQATARGDIEQRRLVPTDYFLKESPAEHVGRSLARMGRFLEAGYTINQANLIDVCNRWRSVKFPGGEGYQS